MNNQQKQAFEALRKKMNEAGVTESELNEFIEGNSSKRNITKEKESEAYIKAKLRDSNEYLGCEENRRKQLITCDLYDLEQAFEDGWDAAKKTLLDKACDYLYKLNQMNFNEYGRHCPLVNVPAFRKAMEEQL